MKSMKAARGTSVPKIRQKCKRIAAKGNTKKISAKKREGPSAERFAKASTRKRPGARAKTLPQITPTGGGGREKVHASSRRRVFEKFAAQENRDFGNKPSGDQVRLQKEEKSEEGKITA